MAPGPTRVPEPGASWRPAPKPRDLLMWAAAMSILAAALHAMAAPEHWEEWWGYGLFFVVSAVAQMGYGLVLILFAARLESRLPAWARRERLFYVLGIAGNVAIVALYAWTRMVGVPAGPMLGEREAVEPMDLVSKASEIALVGLLAIALWKGDRGAPWREMATLQ